MSQDLDDLRTVGVKFETLTSTNRPIDSLMTPVYYLIFIRPGTD